MLLDVAGPLLGIGLAIAGFVVVVLVCVAVLRLLTVVLSGSDPGPDSAEEPDPEDAGGAIDEPQAPLR